MAAALALAQVLQCSVEDLFGRAPNGAGSDEWAWPPAADPCRFWRARIGERVLHIPVEPTVAGILPHDGVCRRGKSEVIRHANPESTLVLASCDPAAGLLASEYERATGFRLLPIHRSSSAALDLLRRGLVHVAGIHLTASNKETGNARAAKPVLGDGYSLLRFAAWEEGLAVHSSLAVSSVHALLRAKLRWIGREAGAGARQCQDQILGDRPQPRRIAQDHRGVAEAVRCGWADVGVCLRLVSEEAGLKFVRVREEAYDLCFPEALERDARVRGLIAVIRSAAVRILFTSLPGYRLASTLALCRI